MGIKMGFSKSDIKRDECMLTDRFGRKGYDWWWHSFTGKSRRTGKEKSFFIEFFLCNPNYGGKRPVFDKPHPSYLMVKAGAWGEDAAQLHRFFGWEQIELNGKAPFAIAAEDCYLSEKATKGRIRLTEDEVKKHPEYMCEAGSMSWRLRIDKKIPFQVGYGAGALFRRLQAFEMFWHAEGMKTCYSGTVKWNGEVYDVTPEDCYGYADKNWGSSFTDPWVWLSSNDMVRTMTGERLKNSVFDIGGGTPCVFGIPLGRKLLGAFYREGEEFEFNFSKFWTHPRTKFQLIELPDQLVWRVKQETRKAVMFVEVRCKKKDMLLIRYQAPDGTCPHTRLCNGGTGTGRIRLYRKDGIYRTLAEDVRIGHVGCEFGVCGSARKAAGRGRMEGK